MCRSLDTTAPFLELPRKEVIQPHLPVRLPCYDFTPVTSPTFDGSLPKGWATGFGCCSLPWCDGRCVQGPGTYSPRSEEHTSELQSRQYLVCRLLLEKKKKDAYK